MTEISVLESVLVGIKDHPDLVDVEHLALYGNDIGVSNAPTSNMELEQRRTPSYAAQDNSHELNPNMSGKFQNNPDSQAYRGRKPNEKLESKADKVALLLEDWDKAEKISKQMSKAQKKIFRENWPRRHEEAAWRALQADEMTALRTTLSIEYDTLFSQLSGAETQELRRGVKDRKERKKLEESQGQMEQKQVDPHPPGLCNDWGCERCWNRAWTP